MLPALRDGAFVALIARARSRARGLAALHGAGAGLALAAVVLTLGAFSDAGVWTPVGVAASSGLLGALIAAVVARPTTSDVARRLERATPDSHNLLRTAAELTSGGITAPAYVSARILQRADTLAARVDLRRGLPAGRALAGALVAASGSALVIALSAVDPLVPGPATPAPSSDTAATIDVVTIAIAPPEYTGRAAVTLTDPSRIDALAGSRIHVRVGADAAAVTIETLAGGAQSLVPTGSRAFAGDVLATTDGFLALTPVSAGGAQGSRRLVGLTVTPDLLPRVHVTAPGRDLIFAGGDQTISLAIDADDDIGLATLGLRYTRLTGSGENFTFVDGEVPVTVTRASERAWTARTMWSIAPLGLEPGDMVIYRAVATDRRPNAPVAESDTFVIEIAAPGSVATEGFAIDDRENRYAISQQMVILKTERLIAARSTMAPDDVRREAMAIAAEQRQVRAEFVFMMGGELADHGLDATSLGEEHEAEGEDELAAGRLRNQGRADLMAAIRAMSRAAAQLAENSLTAALPIERQALTYLQRAFSRNRYILRTLSERERLDLTRRLTGVLAALARGGAPAAEPDEDARVIAMRRALGDLASLAADVARGGSTAGTDAATRAGALAQRVLAVDPASPALIDVAAALTTAADLLARPMATTTAVAREFDRAATGLAAAARAGLPSDTTRPSSPELDVLAGRLADALRGGGRR